MISMLFVMYSEFSEKAISLKMILKNSYLSFEFIYDFA